MRHWERPAARAGITRGQLLMGIAVLLAMATVMAIALTPRQPVMESPNPCRKQAARLPPCCRRNARWCRR